MTRYRVLLRALLVLLFAFVPGCREEPAVVPRKTSDAPPQLPSLSHKPPSRPDGVLPHFRTIAAESGLDFQRFDDIQGQRKIMEANGGGVAMFDSDRDGRLDLFYTNGCEAPLRRNDRTHPGALFRNLGGMRFELVTESSRLVQHGYTCGTAVGDFDNDGFDDLYITAFGRNAFWHNNGDGTFSDITDATQTAVPAWSSSAAFYDLNGDGALDLYVANYLDESDEHPRLCPNDLSPDGYEGCSPAIFEGVDDVLLMSDGEGRFIDVSEESGVSGLKGKGLGVAIVDLDANGTPEIYVANDGQANFLFVADDAETPASDGTLKVLRWHERALTANVALNEMGYAQASMGIAVGDYDRNRTADLFLTHFFGDTNTLYTNRGELAFDDATRASNLGLPSRKFLGFGTLFIDADNDGWLDLFVANGHVDDRTWMADDEPYAMRPQFFRNNSHGNFDDVSAWSGEYFTQDWVGRGVAAGDLDRDGKIDLAVSHQLAPSVVLQNQTASVAETVTLRFVSKGGDRSGYGTRIEVTGADPPLVREVIGGGSFQSASALELQVPVSPKDSLSIRIRWRFGVEEQREGLTAGMWTIVEGDAPRRTDTTKP